MAGSYSAGRAGRGRQFRKQTGPANPVVPVGREGLCGGGGKTRATPVQGQILPGQQANVPAMALARLFLCLSPAPSPLGHFAEDATARRRRRPSFPLMLLSKPPRTALPDPPTVSDICSRHTPAPRSGPRRQPTFRALPLPAKANASPLLLSLFGKAGSAPSSDPAHNRRPTPMSQRRIPTAASRWTKETLDVLGAVYDRHDVYHFEFDDAALPTRLRNGMHGIFIFHC